MANVNSLQRVLGKTGLQVSLLGFGAAQIGFIDTGQTEVNKLLNGLLDAGMTLIDTAACYQNSEEKVGQAIASRRGEYVLVSKCGHARQPDDPPEWSPEIIRHSAERSLRRLQTDHLDVLLLHSCGVSELKNEKMIGELERCKRDGLTRFIGYSGDNEEAELAASMNVFDVLETSVSFCDQQVLDRALPKARQADLGVLSKRTIANTAWRDLSNYGADGFYENYKAEYTRRLKQMNFTPESIGFDGDWLELALRFTVFQPGVSCGLIGGQSLDHIIDDMRLAEKGPLPEEIVNKLREIWRKHDDGGWIGQM